MIFGMKVKGLSESGSWTFVTLETEDKVEMRISFRNEDPRIKEFRFGEMVMLEINSTTSSSPVRLIK